MKRFWWVLLTAPLFLQFQTSRGSFAGSWELDLKNSVNLPPSFKSVDSYVIDIAQKGDSLTVVATMKGNGQTVPFPPFVYSLDGKETYRKDSLRGSERWMSAGWAANGKSVVMDTRVLMKQAGRPAVEMTQHDDWKLVGGTSLDVSITQKMKGTDSVRTERRIFRKLK
ncbi:MAG TPA: hypothetical protein VI932_12525 [Bacteroidota bacterium]|nr:hypothetical protein [Bacteroidota bacterium]